jgi:hypothetical protein
MKRDNIYAILFAFFLEFEIAIAAITIYYFILK